MHKVDPQIRHEWMKGRCSSRLTKEEVFHLNLEHVNMLVANGALSMARQILHFYVRKSQTQRITPLSYSPECAVCLT